MILFLIGLLVLINFFNDFAFDFYDLFPGESHGFNNFITYPSVIYLLTIVYGFKYLSSNDLQNINNLIIIFLLFGTIRTYGIIVNGLKVTLFVIMAYPAEFLGAPLFYYLKKKVENTNNI
tara:strand:+ start:165 stop:524 length:360 start_codon:yes stop_codon:yes gene_type:complete